MQITNQIYWNNVIQIPDNREIAQFAENWANAMEEKISAGHKLSDIAEETSNHPSGKYLSGATFRLALRYLVNAWKHGEELRQWNNKKLGIPEANVVNITPEKQAPENKFLSLWHKFIDTVQYSDNRLLRILRGVFNFLKGEKV